MGSVVGINICQRKGEKVGVGKQNGLQWDLHKSLSQQPRELS